VTRAFFPVVSPAREPAAWASTSMNFAPLSTFTVKSFPLSVCSTKLEVPTEATVPLRARNIIWAMPIMPLALGLWRIWRFITQLPSGSCTRNRGCDRSKSSCRTLLLPWVTTRSVLSGTHTFVPPTTFTWLEGMTVPSLWTSETLVGSMLTRIPS
jgi:hypothetical protein